jgi:hypothetical protein
MEASWLSMGTYSVRSNHGTPLPKLVGQKRIAQAIENGIKKKWYKS